MFISSGANWREQPAARIVAGSLVLLYFASIANDREVRGGVAEAAVVFAALILAGGTLLVLARPGRGLALAAIAIGALGMGWVAPHSAGSAPLSS